MVLTQYGGLCDTRSCVEKLAVECVTGCMFLQGLHHLTHQHTMISDVQLALFANVLGILVFVLVVLYHYVAANNPKKLKPQ